MAFLSTKISEFVDHVQNHAGLLLAGVSLFATMSASAQIDSTLTYQDGWDITEQLLENARQNPEELFKLVENKHSRDIHSLQTAANNLLIKQGRNADQRIYSLDMAKWDVAKALGLKNPLESTFGQDAQKLNKKILEAADYVLGEDTQKTIYDGEVYAISPSAHANEYRKDPGARFFMPQSAYAATQNDQLFIRGLTYQQKLEYVNRHEIAHAFTNRYNREHMVKDSLWLENHFDQNNIFIQDSVAKEISIKAGHQRYLNEAYADVTALGGMIRNGEPLDIIDHVAAWRWERAADLIHLSSSVLEAFKHEITDMGLKRFCKMTDIQAEKFYARMIDKYALTVDDFMALSPDNKDENLRPDLLVLRKQFNEVSEKVDSRTFKIDYDGYDDHYWELSDALRDWEPSEELVEAAYKYGGKVTPETVTLAYGLLQNELMEKTAADPAQDYLYREKMARMEQAYLADLDFIDYAEENQKRSVPITELQKPLNSAFYTKVLRDARNTVIADDLPSQHKTEELNIVKEQRAEIQTLAKTPSLKVFQTKSGP